MRCSKCGAKVSKDDRFCRYCNNALVDEPTLNIDDRPDACAFYGDVFINYQGIPTLMMVMAASPLHVGDKIELDDGLVCEIVCIMDKEKKYCSSVGVREMCAIGLDRELTHDECKSLIKAIKKCPYRDKYVVFKKC